MPENQIPFDTRQAMWHMDYAGRDGYYTYTPLLSRQEFN